MLWIPEEGKPNGCFLEHGKGIVGRWPFLSSALAAWVDLSLLHTLAMLDFLGPGLKQWG